MAAYMNAREPAPPTEAPSRELIRQIGERCKSQKTRGFSEFPGAPHDWKPDEVRHPETGERFNTMTAWAFMGQQFVEGAAVKLIILRKPPGQKAYELIVDGYGGAEIYMKVQMGPRKVIARSFHNSTVQRKRP